MRYRCHAKHSKAHQPKSEHQNADDVALEFAPRSVKRR